jgi:hypothetical protein
LSAEGGTEKADKEQRRRLLATARAMVRVDAAIADVDYTLKRDTKRPRK